MCPRCRKAVASSARFCPSCGQPLASTTVSFGDYETTALIGEGGMGRVYKAVQRKLNRPVCIKTLLPQFASDQAVSKRFEREATTIAALVHPNIVSVFDVGLSDEGVPYIVMEFVDGRPLRSVLRDEAPVAFPRAVKIVDQVLAALSEAHTRGIIHRDLKPANVMVVALQDGSELCKVLDFGIAKVMDDGHHEEKLTGAGMVLGTPGYMAPEQLSGEPYDHRIDLYAAGVMLYELVTGQRVFRAPNDTELMKKTLLETPAPPSTRTSTQVPAALDQVCLKALSRHAKDRFQNAAEFREALAQLGRSSTASSPSFIGEPTPTQTPLAVALEGGEASTNSRALLSAVLGASDEWERGRLIGQFERSLTEQLVDAHVEAVKATVASLQAELKDKGQSVGVKLLVDSVRSVLLGNLPLLLEWLASEPRRPDAQWMLRLLGKASLGTYVQELPGLDAAVRPHLLAVMRLLDPDGKLLLAALKGVPLATVKAVLGALRGWPEELVAQLFSQLLQSTDPALRQGALESLDEHTAFRLGTIVRQRLHDPIPAVRGEALKWVVRQHDEQAVGELTKLLERTSVLPAERRAVWRVLGVLKTDAAVTGLIWALKGATELDQQAELATLLVRSKVPRAVEAVRTMAQASANSFKLKRALDEALREAH